MRFDSIIPNSRRRDGRPSDLGTEATTPMRRIIELDALRGIAAIVIVVFHMRFLDAYPAMGTAVDLFFVLSGYLITTIILEQGRSPGFFGTFYARRSLRIWPIYYLALVACVAVNPLLGRPEPLDGFWYFFAYLQHLPGYWHAETPAFSRLFLHTWTLAIEEQFYLLWPLVVVVLGRKRLLWGIMPLLIAPIVMRANGFDRHMLLTRCDSLALGALLARIFLDRARIEANRSRSRLAFVAIGLIAVLGRQVVGPLVARLDPIPGGVWSVWMFALATAQMSWLYFSLVGIVLLDHGHRRLRWLRSPALVHLGTISYGIYLYHPFVLIFVPMIHKAIGIKGSPWLDVVKLAICILLAEVSWRLVEKPLLGFKDRFPYRRSALRGPHVSVNATVSAD
jgi:peptidoglycan/LPS O-acetylase OafA/YrhL